MTALQPKLSFFSVSDKSSMSQTDDADYVEGVVCKTTDLNDDEMKVFDLAGEDNKVLLVKQNGLFHALGAKCTHYGAPLQNGVLGQGRIRCQWHGACFNLTNGDIEDFPGLDSLPCYSVVVEDDKVKVRAKKSDLENGKRVKQMIKRDHKNVANFVIVGGGPAGAVCAETLRQEGFTGKITLITKEEFPPYERIKLSKAMDLDISKAQLRSGDFYVSSDIDVMTGTTVKSVSAGDHFVVLADDTTVNYERLLIASGSSARTPDLPGAQLENVVVLRDYAHAQYIASQLSKEKNVVILGSSFIGMEAANYCVDKVAKVTVISRDKVPFEGPFGPQIGAAVMELFKSKGVNFVMESGINKCIGNGSLTSVELADGSVLPADLCIMGVGTVNNTSFVANSGITLTRAGAVEVDEYLRTNVEGVYAAGDVAHAPVWSSPNTKAAIGHWGLAHYHGRVAALNMLDRNAPLKSVPYFWTMLFGKGIRYAGHGRYDEIIHVGDVPALKFVAFYLKGDEVIAISSCQMDPIVSKYAEYVSQGKRLHKQDLEQADPLSWSKQ